MTPATTTPPSTPTFNLVTQPWIAVAVGDGEREVLSLRDTFHRAHELRAIAGELPTQDVAILRLMLAVLHRAVRDLPGSAVQRWGTLWDQPTLPVDLIDGYLDEWSHRFDLLDLHHPFMQVAGLRASKLSGLTKIVTDVPDGHAFFTTREGAQLQSMSFAEAARWLVHTQAFDVSGIKTGAIGDPRVKGGKGYPIGTGWAGRCGHVVVEHRTLRDTLLLNLVLEPKSPDAADDLPLWERPPLGPAVEKDHPVPVGQADLLTWPSRRILLQHNGIQVTDVLLTNGDRLDAANWQHIEASTSWRRSLTQEKARPGAGTVYFPRTHDPERSLWRGLGTLLLEQGAEGSGGKEPAMSLPPRVVAWLGVLSEEGKLTDSLEIKLHAVGMSYGPQDASVAAIYDDALAMPAGVATNPPLRGTALRAASTADAVAQAIAHLAGNLSAAAGGSPDGPRQRAREDAFFRFDAPFRAWLAALHNDDEDALLAAEQTWQQSVRGIARDAAANLVLRAGESAWKGREVMGRHVDSGQAQAWFLAALAKALPLIARPPRREPNTDPTGEVA